MTKDELIKARDRVNHFLMECGSAAQYYLENDNKVLYDGCLDMRDIYNTILQALDAQIKACDVPNNKKLEKAIWYCRDDWQCKDGLEALYEQMDIIISDARAYHKLTGGEK